MVLLTLDVIALMCSSNVKIYLIKDRNVFVMTHVELV